MLTGTISDLHSSVPGTDPSTGEPTDIGCDASEIRFGAKPG